MSILDEIIMNTLGLVMIVFSVFLIISLSLITFDVFTGKTCKATYSDVQYSIWGGCKIKYNGEYIPKELYIKSFEQNLNINK